MPPTEFRPDGTWHGGCTAHGMRLLICSALLLLASCGGKLAPDPQPEPATGVSAGPVPVTAASDKGACGGPSHVGCAAGSYCWSNGCQVQGEEAGACFTPVTDCETIYVPACGCDGNVYQNVCEATRSGVGWRGDSPGPTGDCQ